MCFARTLFERRYSPSRTWAGSACGHTFHGCQFIDTDLRHADFTSARLAQCNFQGATLKDAGLDDVEAPPPIFSARRSGVPWRPPAGKQHLGRERLRAADLFTGSDLRGAVFHRADAWGTVRFAQAHLEGARLFVRRAKRRRISIRPRGANHSFIEHGSSRMAISAAWVLSTMTPLDSPQKNGRSAETAADLTHAHQSADPLL